MIDVTLNIPARTPHLCQVVTGFIMLEKQGKAHLSINGNAKLPSEGIAEAVIGDTKIAYDMADGYNFRSPAEIDKYIEKCNFYFKRSFSDKLNKEFFPNQTNKIYKWGFNYLVTCNGNVYFNKNPKKKLLEAVNLVRGRKPLKYFTYDRFEALPNRIVDPKILFMTRLWDSSQTSSKNLDAVNSTRIEIVKALRREYSKSSTAGIYDSELARALCPELILPPKVTKRESYLETMKNSDICIGSIGLHGSIGWKTGEYVAAARAVINESFCYEVSGSFEIGKNYFSFKGVDECMKHVDTLFHSPDLIYEMKKNNHQYYLDYLRPDIQVTNSLREAGVTI